MRVCIDAVAGRLIAEASQCKQRGNTKYSARDFEGAAREYSDGLDALAQFESGSSDKMDLLVTLHSNRGACFLALAMASVGTGATTAAERCVVDCSAVIDLCSHASDVMLVKNRLKRARAAIVTGDVATARDDVSAVEAAAAATAAQRDEARALAPTIAAARRAAPSPLARPFPAGLRELLLTHDDLTRLLPRATAELALGREYMDKPGPVSMSDGTPKRPPFEIRGDETAAELTRRIGPGAGSYFGELELVFFFVRPESAAPTVTRTCDGVVHYSSLA